MTTVKEKFTELFQKHPTWCNRAKKLLKDESADMYNSSRRPDVWMQGIAYMNLPKAREVVAAVVQHVAAELNAGDLKTKMASLSASSTAEELDALIAWAEPLRNGAGPFDPGGPTPTECKLLYSAAKFLRDEDLPYIKAPATYFLTREVDKGQTREEASVVVADFFRSQATLAEWRGPYE